MLSIVPQNQEVTMTTLDFLEQIINPARYLFGEKPVANDKFLKRVIDEIGFTENEKLSFTQEGHFKPTAYFNLNYDQMMLVGMRESKGVRKSILSKLKELTQPKEDPMVLLARQVIALDEENKRLAATKAQINDKRTATLMNKASQDAKRIKKLESKLQDVGEYQSIIAAGLPQRTETEVNPKAQTWRVLKKISEDMNLPPKKVKDERYGEVNTYHVSVITRYKEEYLF